MGLEGVSTVSSISMTRLGSHINVGGNHRANKYAWGNQGSIASIFPPSVSSISMTRIGVVYRAGMGQKIGQGKGQGQGQGKGKGKGQGKDTIPPSTAAAGSAVKGPQKGIAGILERKHKSKGQGQGQGQGQGYHNASHLYEYEYGFTKTTTMIGSKLDKQSTVSWGSVSMESEEASKGDVKSEEKSVEVEEEDDDALGGLMQGQIEIVRSYDDHGEDGGGDGDWSVATSTAAMTRALRDNTIHYHNNQNQYQYHNNHHHNPRSRTTTLTSHRNPHPNPQPRPQLPAKWISYRCTTSDPHHEGDKGYVPGPDRDAFSADRESCVNDEDTRADSQETPLRLARHIYPPPQPQRSEISELSCSKAGGQRQGPVTSIINIINNHNNHHHNIINPNQIVDPHHTTTTNNNNNNDEDVDDDHNHWPPSPRAVNMENRLLFEACDQGHVDVVQLLLARARDRARAKARKKILLTKARARDLAKARNKARARARARMTDKARAGSRPTGGGDDDKGAGGIGDGDGGEDEYRGVNAGWSMSPDENNSGGSSSSQELFRSLEEHDQDKEREQRQDQDHGWEEQEGEYQDQDEQEQEPNREIVSIGGSSSSRTQDWLEEKDSNGETALMRAIRWGITLGTSTH